MSESKDLAKKFGLPIAQDLLSYPLIQSEISLVPYLYAKRKGLIPVDQSEEFITIATSNPLDIEATEELRLLLKKKIHPLYSPSEVIERAIEKCYHQKEEETKDLVSSLPSSIQRESETQVEGYDLLEKNEHHSTIRVVNSILLEAIQQGASDVHFEPTEEGILTRYRIDGLLQKRHSLSYDLKAQVLTRIKVMAKMDIAEQRLPQDGRMKLRHGGREIDFRVSTLPTTYGERIVLRILDRTNVFLGINQIGMGEKALHLFRKLISMPEGILLVTGPTGSGKTTTLYSAIGEINHQETNIITVEDPIEYKIPGISQVAVNPKIDLDFAKILKHTLRQDPDVIMIGEIRDRETAEIAIQASLTGHLVFSTLHTNDAPSALTRLADMGIEPYLLASSILGVVAQRLVRKLCPHCRVEYDPEEKEMAELGFLPNGPLCRGEGCPNCFFTGYKGRHAIYEIMHVGKKIKSQVLKSQDAQELRKVALEEGMKTLFDQGVELVIQKITSSSELLRVTQIDQENF